MFVQRDLSWMIGFPLANDEWVSLSPGRPISKRRLDGELLHRSTLAVRSLVRSFPQALPQLVGDTDAWARRRLALLETLKPTVHQRQPLPEEPLAHHPEVGESLLRQLRRARREAPRLESLVSALTWLCWTDLGALRPALRWLSAHRTALEALGAAPGGEMPLAVRLWQLQRAHGHQRVGPCLDWLSRPGVFTHPTDCPEQFGHQAAGYFERSRKRPPEKPKPRLAAELILWLEEVAQLDGATRKRALELFPLLLHSEGQVKWHQWWERAEATLATARAFHRAPRDRRPPASRQKRLRGDLRRLDSIRPPRLPAEQVMRVLRELPRPDHLELYRTVAPCLRRWPELLESSPVRLAFASYWLELALLCDPPEKAALRRIVRSLCRYWRAKRFSPQALEPWAPVWRRPPGKNVYLPLDRRLLRSLKERGKLTTFFEVLAQAREPVSTAEAGNLVTLVAELPATRVKGAFRRLRESPLASGHLSEELIALAGRLTSGDEGRFLAVLGALTKHERRHATSAETLGRVADALDAVGRPQVVSRCIQAGSLKLLVEVGLKSGFLADLGEDVPGPDLRPAAARPTWSRHYPPLLRPAIRELARCDDRAERTARRLLRKDFPEPAALRREIAALRRAGSPDPGKATRLRNLEARLEAESQVSPQRLANLEEKLLDSAARGLVERWSRALSRAYDNAMLRYLDVPELPPWSGRDDVSQALLAVRGLEPPFRKLARRLLRRRCGPPPWDLREDPANAAFLARLADLGVDCGPWVDGGPALGVEDGGGNNIRLDLERDPLEILQMGGHFQTCLAPGACNYFSAFANACDINKQVLYGRDHRGSVVARALLALTAEGGLLCFFPYCRASDLGFDRHAQHFARQLAEAMGTLVVARGAVPRLVAADWWDDGPTDPAHQHPALEEGSALRQALEEISPERVVKAIRAAFAPLDCNELTLPLVLQLPELEARPRLALGLTRLAERLELPTDALLRLGKLLKEAGAIEEARALAPRLVARAVESYRQLRYEQLEIIELLTDLDPSRALRLLHQTRARDVRRWEQEEQSRRLILGARASGELGRRKQARRLLELARQRSFDKAARAECDRLLAALD